MIPLIYPVDRPYRLDETEPSAPSGGTHLKKNMFVLLCFFVFQIQSLCLLATSQNLVNHPFSLWVDLAIYSPSKFLDPSQVLRNALVYRKFVISLFFYCMVDELWRFPSENHPKRPISGMGTFGVYYQNNIFSGQCIFWKHTFWGSISWNHLILWTKKTSCAPPIR